MKLKKHIIIVVAVLISTALYSQKSIHEFTVKDIYGEDFKLSNLKGKKVLIVNTASKCGLTPQYESLEKLIESPRPHPPFSSSPP